MDLSTLDSSNLNTYNPKTPYSTRIRNKYHRRQKCLVNSLEWYLSVAKDFVSQKGTRNKENIKKEIEVAETLLKLLPRKKESKDEIRSWVTSLNNLFNLPEDEESINKMVDEIFENQ